MVLGSLAPAVYGRLDASVNRAGAVTRRNIAALRSVYWIVLLSGLVEPVLYLFSIGVGVGRLIGSIQLPDGRSIGYAQFVAPAMLASSAMSGALTESTFNIFAKLKFMRLYDGVLATPVRPMEIAVGELIWAMVRGAVYSAAFLAVMVAMHLTTPVRAVAAVAASLLVGFAFGALGMALSTRMRSWQDFDLVGSAQLALFLFSATFTPLSTYPAPARLVIEATPLYQSVALLRGLTTGTVDIGLWVHAGYLMAVTLVGLVLASRRMGRLLLS